MCTGVFAGVAGVCMCVASVCMYVHVHSCVCSVCMYVCTGMCAGVLTCVHVWSPEESIGYLPLSRPACTFEAGSLPKPGSLFLR